jgi:hypothetical protein
MTKLLDKEGITSFQKIYQLSQEIAEQIPQQNHKQITQSAPVVHFWDFEEDEPYPTLNETKQVA